MANSMILITSNWQDQKTFKMIPVTKECPFNEAIFDPDAKVLAIVGTAMKPAFHMLPKLDENGDPLMAKRRTANNPNPYAQQRVTIDTYYEYFLEEQSEIETFVKAFASNADSFDYSSYLKKAFVTKDELPAAV